MPTYEYDCQNCGRIEIFHSIMEDAKTVCPECDEEGLVKKISSGGAIIIGGREANQYADILKAKYWRDKNGVRHKVGPGDGHTGSGTVSKQTATPEEVKARKARDKKASKKYRIEESYRRFVKKVKKK